MIDYSKYLNKRIKDIPLSPIEEISILAAQEKDCIVLGVGEPDFRTPWRIREAGIQFKELEHPVMITEDFSWYQRHLPGMYFFLGTGPSPVLQADDFDFDESVLDTGADFLEALALGFRSE